MDVGVAHFEVIEFHFMENKFTENKNSDCVYRNVGQLLVDLDQLCKSLKLIMSLILQNLCHAIISLRKKIIALLMID